MLFRDSPIPSGRCDVGEGQLENMVPREGVEPPTPAFSGLQSTNVIYLKQQHLASLQPAFRLQLWEAKWKQILRDGVCLKRPIPATTSSRRPSSRGTHAKVDPLRMVEILKSCAGQDLRLLTPGLTNSDPGPRVASLNILRSVQASCDASRY